MSEELIKKMNLVLPQNVVWGFPLNFPLLLEIETNEKSINLNKYKNTPDSSFFEINFGVICCWFSSNTIIGFSNKSGEVFIRKPVAKFPEQNKHIRKIAKTFPSKLCTNQEFAEYWKQIITEIFLTEDVEAAVKAKLARENAQWKDDEVNREIRKNIRRVKVKNENN